MTPVFRAPMRARDRDSPTGEGARFGIAHGVVGMGDDPGERGERRLARFAQIDDGAFVWTRTAEDEFRLGRITGEHRRDESAPARAVGIAHVRDTTWLDHPFGPGEIPAAVVATFARGGRNLQRTHDVDAEARTAELWSRYGPTSTA